MLDESIVNYAKKVAGKFKFLFKKIQENIKKQIQILLKSHFETIEPSIGFIVNQLQNFKNFGIIKVKNK